MDDVLCLVFLVNPDYFIKFRAQYFLRTKLLMCDLSLFTKLAMKKTLYILALLMTSISFSQDVSMENGTFM